MEEISFFPYPVENPYTTSIDNVSLFGKTFHHRTIIVDRYPTRVHPLRRQPEQTE